MSTPLQVGIIIFLQNFLVQQAKCFFSVSRPHQCQMYFYLENPFLENQVWTFHQFWQEKLSCCPYNFHSSVHYFMQHYIIKDRTIREL